MFAHLTFFHERLICSFISSQIVAGLGFSISPTDCSSAAILPTLYVTWQKEERTTVIRIYLYYVEQY